eukprot:268343_1
MTLEEILTTKDGFDLYMMHLVRTFSVESLLFLFEMMQIKKQIIVKHLLDNNSNEVGIIIQMNCERINKNRRQSGIIISIDTLKDNLQHIVGKYIKHNSPHEINISFKTRQKILSVFAKVNDHVYNVPKYDWIDTRNVYQSHNRYLSRTRTDSFGRKFSNDDEETSQLEMKTPKATNGLQRMKAVDDIIIDSKTINKAPKYEWIDNKTVSIDDDMDISKGINNNDKIIVHRMHAIDDIKVEPLQEVPTYDWINNKGNNTLENEKCEMDNQLMIEYLQTFDRAISEIRNLLNGDSLLRFYATNDYQRVLQKFIPLKSCTRH